MFEEKRKSYVLTCFCDVIVVVRHGWCMVYSKSNLRLLRIWGKRTRQAKKVCLVRDVYCWTYRTSLCKCHSNKFSYSTHFLLRAICHSLQFHVYVFEHTHKIILYFEKSFRSLILSVCFALVWFQKNALERSFFSFSRFQFLLLLLFFYRTAWMFKETLRPYTPKAS